MSSDEQKIEYKRPIRKRISEMHLPPNVNSIKDLIEMAQSGKKYQNINNEMLWKISAQLIEIDEMIGMKSLKESIFYHVIYYLQNLFIENERDYLHTVIMGPPGTGKCLGRDTPVMMYDGTIKVVQNIKEGDLLMGDDSTPRKVLSICAGVEEMYKIKSLRSDDKDDSYIVNKSHILSLKNKDSGEYEDVKLRDYLNDPDKYLGYRTSIQLENGLSGDIDPYILGYSMCNYQFRNEHIYISITNPVVQSYFSCSNSITKVRQTEYKFTREDYFPYFSKSCCVLPDQFFLYNSKFLKELLSGINDAYGQVDIETNTSIFRFTDEQYKLYRFIKTICNLLGIEYECTIKSMNYTVFPTIQERNYFQPITTYYLTLYNIFDVISSMIYQDTFNIPKYERRICEYPISVRSIGTDEYFGFEIDGNQRFVLGNCTVTHNTTIAKIIGEMYKNMGVLSPSGVFKIAKREDLVAEYLGQTAVKTKKLLESCIGGVLFIDEVYALGPGKKDKDSFAKEAIDTINVFLSENSDTFCCIIAGYEQDIRNCFFSVNQGLERRFQWVHRIEPYSSEELSKMFMKLLYDIKWKKDSSVTIESLTKIIDENKHLFGSFGGDIENLITKCKMAHAKRIINLKNPNKYIITLDDIKFAISLMKPNSLEQQTNNDMSFMHLYL